MRKHSAGHGVTLIDLLVAAVILTFIGVVLVPHIAARTREEQNRIKCASHLQQIGLAMKLYANEEPRTQAFPRTRYDIKTADKPVFYTHPETTDSSKSPFVAGGPDVNDVTASIWLLLRTQDITTDVFVCPSAGTKPFEIPAGQHEYELCNFASAESLSYSMQNPFPTKSAIGRGFVWNDSMSARAPLMADMNPGAPSLIKAKSTGTAAELRKLNSPNHGFDGQNVLYADGHVEWAQSVFVGVASRVDQSQTADNIYTFRTPDAKGALPAESAGIIGPSGDPEDAVLLPTWDAKIPFPKVDLTAPATTRP